MVIENRVAQAVLGLMRWANRADVRRQVWALEGARLSAAELSLLVALADQGPVRSTDLASSLGVDKSTISPQAKRLEGLGLVLRTPAADDRRAAMLSLTALGRRTTRRLERAVSGLMDARLAHWSREDREALVTLLERLVRDLSVTSSPPVSHKS